MQDDRNELNDLSVVEHVPVLKDALLELLAIEPGQVIVDCTVGSGGHSAAIARLLGPAGRIIAIDQDPENLDRALARVSGCRVDWVHANFAQIVGILGKLGIAKVDRLLADLGVSSVHLDRAERGFSFRLAGPLDMRMNPGVGVPASQLVNSLPERELARIFWEYGEERFSRQLAARIVQERKKKRFETTTELADLVRSIVPREQRGRAKQVGRGGRIDPATRVFQALRIAVNDELGSLDQLLHDLPTVLRRGGRAAIISFHSLEDRRVKESFKNQELWKILTKKPVTASDLEISQNPRARSAKLRAAERL